MALKITYDILTESHPDVATLEDKLVGYDPDLGLKYRRIVDWGNKLYGFYYYKTLDGNYGETTDLYLVSRVDVFSYEYRFKEK